MRSGITSLGVLLLVVSAVGNGAAESIDGYGGLTQVVGQRGDMFHLEKIGARWWLVTPAGHGIFPRAVSKVDVADYGGAGGFRAYDAVYLETADGVRSANLAAAAENSLAGDVIHPQTRVTLKSKGDAFYLGAAHFKPNFTYFWFESLGEGGTLQWFYSTEQGWKPIGQAGRPFKAAALGPDGEWSFDRGNFMAPDESGFGKQGNSRANRVVWWDMAQGFPADWAAIALPGDATRRYCLKAVVERDFRKAPVLNQCYERAELEDEIARKYGPGDYSAKWAAATTERLKTWGFNAAGQYSPRYAVKAPALKHRLPGEPTWALGGWATQRDRPYHVKNVYAGAVFPPGSGTSIYQGLQPDVFDPQCERAYVELVRKQAAENSSWNWALIFEEADYLFGLNQRGHDHLGYVVLAQNPYHPKAMRDNQEIVYPDPRLYAKCALRDFLRHRYRGQNEKLAAFTARSPAPGYAYAREPAGDERAALDKLNAAWGTGYTTWDTAAGDPAQGDNAWGRGSGFMDEDGRGVVAAGARSIAFNKTFTKPDRPAIRTDLDDFMALFAARYGVVLEKAFRDVPHPPLFLPLYDGPAFVYRELAPYVDGFWVSLSRPEDALPIYNAAHKPLVVADYMRADADSPWHYRARIESLQYDAASGTTTVFAPELRYVFRMATFVDFPDCDELREKQTCGGKYVYPHPRLKAARWNTLAMPGDFTGGVKPGMHIQMWKSSPPTAPTQAERAKAMSEHYEKLMSLRGDDGLAFVIGLEHWCLYDPSVSNWFDHGNFGLATMQDNAYDGVEARKAAGVDARGRPVGGEAADYGDCLGPLGAFLRDIDRRLAQP